MSTETLTSLAILKVHIDHGSDYLNYLRPFVLQVLFDKQPDFVTDESVAADIRDRFGLEIPTRTIQIVLRRLAKSGHLRRDNRTYLLENVHDPGMGPAQEKASQCIRDALDGLIAFADREVQLPLNERQAITAICTFLSSFNVSCLSAYLRGTAIPDVLDRQDRDITLVSKYLMSIRELDDEKFENFMVVVQGHMLANALLCPDLKSAKNYKRTTFFLDTPLLVQLLGLDGKNRKSAVVELLRLLDQLGGRVAIFSHTREELGRVLDGAVAKIDAPDGRGRIVEQARRDNLTRSNFILLTANADESLRESGVDIYRTPTYRADYQIDESKFENILDDGISYFNPKAKEYDINSVRSIYVLRRGSTPSSIETSKAILVTSNTAFARAAWDYGRTFEASREVSSVISDFSLANLAWLKAPMGAPSLPMAEVMAFSYAAVQPSSTLMAQFLHEIDRLKSSGAIKERDHQLLRSSPAASDELVSMTLGDDAALTGSGVREILDRVVREITHETDEKLTAEKAAHEETERKLRVANDQRRRAEENLYWRCGRIAEWVSGVAVVLAFAPGALVVVGQAGYWVGVVAGGPVLTVGLTSLAVWTLFSLIAGTTAVSLHNRIKSAVLRLLFRWLSLN